MNQSRSGERNSMDDSEFVTFWNEVLAPKFIAFKHILVDGLTHHSEAIFPTLPVDEGDRVLDVGCGFGDTAIKLAHLVGPSGEVVGIDCCDVFLDYARKEADAKNIASYLFAIGVFIGTTAPGNGEEASQSPGETLR